MTTLLFFVKYLSACFPSVTLRKIIDPARIRTWNPLIRSQMPYPVGHGATHRTAILLILKITISSIVMVYFSYFSSTLNAFIAEKKKFFLLFFSEPLFKTRIKKPFLLSLLITIWRPCCFSQNFSASVFLLLPEEK